MKTAMCGVVVFFCVFALGAWGPVALGMSRGELIDELATWTSLSRDTLEVLYKESPSLFVNLERVAFTIKTLHLFAQAKDDEVMVELFERFVDVLKPHLLPEPLQVFLTAVRAYKVSLEVIRDKVFIPRFDESIYQSYRSVRLVDWKRQDQSPESVSTAFEGAVAGWSGYYVVQNTMYKELLAHYGYNEDLVGTSLEKKLRSQIDNFWMHRLELRFQREILVQEEARIREMLLESVAEDLKNLNEAASRLSSVAPPVPEERIPSPTPETREETPEVLETFRVLLKQYIEATIAQSSDLSSFVVRVGEALPMGEDRYQVGWQVFTWGENGQEVLVAEDTTRGTLSEFEEAIQHLAMEMEKMTPPKDVEENQEGREASQILLAYREILLRYLEKQAREFEIWNRSRGVESNCSAEILEGATPDLSGLFRVHYRILCRLPDGTVYAPSEFEGTLNPGEIEAHLRQMLEALGEPLPEKETAVASPPVPEEHPSPEKPPQSGGEVVAAFQDLYPRYLQWLAQRETIRAREVFGYDDKRYSVEVVDNAREVSPGVFRIHYRNFVHHGGETKLYNETQMDLTVEELSRLLKNAQDEMGK
jgi:hypothetical protein